MTLKVGDEVPSTAVPVGAVVRLEDPEDPSVVLCGRVTASENGVLVSLRSYTLAFPGDTVTILELPEAWADKGARVLSAAYNDGDPGMAGDYVPVGYLREYRAIRKFFRDHPEALEDNS